MSEIKWGHQHWRVVEHREYLFQPSQEPRVFMGEDRALGHANLLAAMLVVRLRGEGYTNAWTDGHVVRPSPNTWGNVVATFTIERAR
jgi:hypothetical protein